MKGPVARRRARAVPLPARARAARFALGSDDYVVFSFPVAEVGESSGLSPAERQVVELLLAGLSNGKIAHARRTSVRTVANQVASIFRKLGVRSRAELAAHRKK